MSGYSECCDELPQPRIPFACTLFLSFITLDIKAQSGKLDA
jgi:hypothetical protein